MIATATRGAALSALSADIARVAERVRQSVVLVKPASGGQGSGVVWDPSGLIVTNDHVASSDRLTVTSESGRDYEATVITRDRLNDLAILKIGPNDLPTVESVDPRDVRVGELVLAIGNPLGLRGAASIGMYCGVERTASPRSRETRELVRADIDLYPGNSGGPLVDAAGRVVGINAMVTGPGIALAVPTSAVRATIAGQSARRVRIGVNVQSVDWPVAGGGRRTGLMVTGLVAGGPAERGGLIPGDTIVGIGGRTIADVSALQQALASADAGPVSVEVMRGGRLATFVLEPVVEAGVRKAA